MKRLVTALAIVLVAALMTPPLEAQIEAYDLIIMNGRIVDGTGNPWFYGDVAIRGDHIVKVGRIGPGCAARRIDARGLIVAPGFIDMLGQSELNLLIDPRSESKVFQGITTEVTGEGSSPAPLNDYILNELDPFLKHFNITVDWRTLGEYFARLERSRMAINLATYVGATQIRQYVACRRFRMACDSAGGGGKPPFLTCYPSPLASRKQFHESRITFHASLIVQL